MTCQSPKQGVPLKYGEVCGKQEPCPDHDAVFCEHANENPQFCPCELDCYCRSHTCKDKMHKAHRWGETPKIELPKIGDVHPTKRNVAPVPGGIYYHWKTGNLYQVLSMPLHHETKEQMVVYAAAAPSKDVYYRELRSWCDFVCVATDELKWQARFTHINQVKAL